MDDTHRRERLHSRSDVEIARQDEVDSAVGRDDFCQHFLTRETDARVEAVFWMSVVAGFEVRADLAYGFVGPVAIIDDDVAFRAIEASLHSAFLSLRRR